MSSPRIIAHVDLDAFFAAAEVLDNPSLAGKPLVVGSRSPRSVVSTASYEARKFGIRSAMPMAHALKLCPTVIVCPPRMRRYAELSDRFFSVLEHYSPLVEGVSMDEAYLDLTGTLLLFGSATEAMRRLRAQVRAETGLAVSAGIAPVKFAAKIASDLAKPDGIYEITEETLTKSLDPLPVNRLPGVGQQTDLLFRNIRIHTIGELRLADPKRLQSLLGSDLAGLQNLARGIDPREVIPEHETKSVGAEDTFDVDIDDLETIETHLLGQAERVASRLRRKGFVAGGVKLKYKLSDFRLITRQTTLQNPTNDGKKLFEAVVSLLRQHRPPTPIRLCGVSAHALGAPPPAELFVRPDERQQRLNAALDAVRERFGRNSLTRARLLTLDGDGTTRNPNRSRGGPK